MTLARFVRDDWCRIVMSSEVENGPDGPIQDSLMFYIKQTPNGLEKVGLKDHSQEAKAGLLTLHKMMADASGQSWSSCELTVDMGAQCRYDFRFSYDPPKRLNGILDEQSYFRFGSYLDTHRTELEALVRERSGETGQGGAVQPHPEPSVAERDAAERDAGIVAEIEEMQASVLRRVAKGMPGRWRRTVLEYERSGPADAPLQDLLLFYVTMTEDGLKAGVLQDASGHVRANLAELHRAMLRDPVRAGWCGMRATLDGDGKLGMSFSFEPSTRLAGIGDEPTQQRAASASVAYLETHWDELGALEDSDPW